MALRTSTITTLDGKVVVIPNKLIYQTKVINHSASGLRRVEIACGVSYGDDLAQVREVVLNVLGELDASEGTDKESEVIFTEFGDSSINFEARFWVAYQSQWDFLAKKSQAICAIFAAFNKAGITIPFPIRTLDFGQVGGTQLHSQLTEAGVRQAS